MKGLVHIYTGDGKGKTSAAIGLGIRACGRGRKVLMIQFLKGALTGEIIAIKRLEPDFIIKRGREIKKFTWNMDKKEMEELKKDTISLFSYAEQEVMNGAWDVIILDEIMAAIHSNALTIDQVSGIIRNKTEKTELILTGRNAPEELKVLSDYVSEIKAVKHPADEGVPARIGIES